MSADGRVVLNKTSKFGVLDVSGGEGSSMQQFIGPHHPPCPIDLLLTPDYDIGEGV